MSSLAEFFAAIALWLSAMALCQFGVVIESHHARAPRVERTVARTPRQEAIQSVGQTPTRCPHRQVIAVSA